MGRNDCALLNLCHLARAAPFRPQHCSNAGLFARASQSGLPTGSNLPTYDSALLNLSHLARAVPFRP